MRKKKSSRWAKKKKDDVDFFFFVAGIQCSLLICFWLFGAKNPFLRGRVGRTRKCTHLHNTEPSVPRALYFYTEFLQLLFLRVANTRCTDPASALQSMSMVFSRIAFCHFDFAHTSANHPYLWLYFYDSCRSADAYSVTGFLFFIPSYVIYTIGFSFFPISIYVEGFPDLHGFPSSTESILSCTLIWIQDFWGLNPSTQG